jgi:hypothetical protein
MSHHPRLWPLAGSASALLHLAWPGVGPLQAQHRPLGALPDTYCVHELYDRVADSTRGFVLLSARSRRFGLGSSVSADLSYSYRGRQLTATPLTVTLTLQSFTPSRGGWAFARPRPLDIRSPSSLRVQVKPAEYEKQRVRLFDAGRRELLSYRIHTTELARLATEPELSLKAGGAVFRLRGPRMALLREIVHRLRAADFPGGPACS